MQPQTTQPYTVRLMIWAAMLFSIAMYYVVARMAVPASVNDNPLLVNMLLAMAVAVVAGSFGLKAFFHQRAAQANNPGLARAGELIAFTLSEAAALFGLVVWFTTASPHYWWFLALGAVAMLLHFPQRDGQ